MPKVCCNSSKFKLCTVVNENQYSKMIVHLTFSHTHTDTYRTELNQCRSGNNYIISLLANSKKKFTRKLVLHLISHISHKQEELDDGKKNGFYIFFLQSKDCLLYEHIAKMSKCSFFIYFTK